MGSHKESRSRMAATRVEVTRGEFDPREYKKLDKAGWAKKRRADWMATTGKISFVRERVVPSVEREIPSSGEETPAKEIPSDSEEESVSMSELEMRPKISAEGKPKTEFWPRKKRSDITSKCYI